MAPIIQNNSNEMDVGAMQKLLHKCKKGLKNTLKQKAKESSQKADKQQPAANGAAPSPAANGSPGFLRSSSLFHGESSTQHSGTEQVI